MSINDFLTIYFIYYIPISMLLFIINIQVSLNMPVKNGFDSLKEIQNSIDELKKSNPEEADMIENFFNLLLTDERFALIFSMLCFLIPIVRFLIIKNTICEYFNLRN